MSFDARRGLRFGEFRFWGSGLRVRVLSLVWNNLVRRVKEI